MESEVLQALDSIANSIDALAQPRFIDWLAVVFSFLSIAISGIAIWFAVQVPKKIAYRQDKIGLFEKRYECYVVIQDLLTFADQIKMCQRIFEVQAASKMYFGEAETFHDDELAAVLALKLNRKKVLILSGAFLFSNYDLEKLQEIVDVGIDLIMSAATESKVRAQELLSKKTEELKASYCALCEEFEKKYLDAIEKEINLNK